MDDRSAERVVEILEKLLENQEEQIRRQEEIYAFQKRNMERVENIQDRAEKLQKFGFKFIKGLIIIASILVAVLILSKFF